MAVKLVITIIHSRATAERSQNVNQLLTLLKASDLFGDVFARLIGDFDAEALSPDLIKNSTNFDKIADLAPEIDFFNSLIRPIHVRHVSNVLKHQAAFRLIAQEARADVLNLVIEDDVVFGDKVAEILAAAARTAASLPTYDIMFLGLPSAQISGSEPEKSAAGEFTKFYNVAPACESYFVSPGGAKKIADALLPMKFATNVQLSYLIHTAKLAAFFSRPNVFIDGSKIGVFVSSIEANNDLILSSDTQALKELVVNNKAEEARAHFEKMRFKNHPDNVRLMATLEHKQGQYARSKELYEACYKAFASNHGILNNQSAFLKEYVAAFSEFQYLGNDEVATPVTTEI